MNRILKHAIKARATVLLVGDDSQLQPINAGGPFHHLVKTLKATTLSQNWRQKDGADRQAVQNIREGKAVEALKSYQQRERVIVGKTRRDAVHKLVEQWRRSGGVERPREHVIFTETRLEAREINRLCQQERLRKEGGPTPPCLQHHTEKYFVGDRVLFHKADRMRGVENGYRGSIISLNQKTQTIRVQLDEAKPGKCSIVQIPLCSVGADAISLGDASTTHKNQGTSVKHAYVLLGGGMSDRNMAYTQLTRGKESTHLFVDELSAGPDLQQLAKTISKERTKTMAHEQARNIEHDISR